MTRVLNCPFILPPRWAPMVSGPSAR